MKKNMKTNRSIKTISRILAGILTTVLLCTILVYPAAAGEIYLSDVYDSYEEIVLTEELPDIITQEEPEEIFEEEPSEVFAEELVEVFEEESVEVPEEEPVPAEEPLEVLPEITEEMSEPTVPEPIPIGQEETVTILELPVTLEEVITEQETEELAVQLDTVKELKYGDTGVEVWYMQKKLATLGYLSPYAVDGIYGATTLKKVKIFQMYHGLPMTGEADTVTLNTIDSSSLPFYGLATGSYGIAVYGMQTLLYELGYLEFEPDGDYGPRTAQCVKAFQKANGLYEDGEAGALTMDVLAGTPVGNTTAGEISLGAKGKDVIEIQKTLIALGYLPSVADGDFGRVTQAAVIAFQAANGITNPSGSVDLQTRELMKSAEEFTALKKGSKGNDVLVMQKKLVSLGFLSSGSVDGNYNSDTVKAVKRFQMYNGIWINGVAKADTLNALYRCDTSFYSLSIGKDGVATYILQWLLNYYGYMDLAPDGEFGSFTAQAVKKFQVANSLYVDGIVGAYTIDILLSAPKTYSDYQESIVVEFGGTYVINNGFTNGTLEVANSSVYSGANVQLSEYQEYGCQKWVMQNAGNGLYYIRNLRSWKVLEVSDGNVQQGEYSGSAAQMWKIVKAEGGGYYIVNSNGRYLAGDSNNAAAYDPNGSGKYQVWYLEEVDPGTALDFRTDGTQYLGIRTFDIYQGNVTETSGYYKIKTEIDLPSGGYYLSGGDNYSIGLKVMYVNSFLANAGYLGWDYYNYNRYDGNTVWAVKQFQSDYGLGVDGIVGLQEWLYMGYSEYDWYNLGSYTTGLKVYAYGSSRDTYVNAMLNTAYEYMVAGTGFADGASGKPGTYVDCSGLIYQCLYAAGINPDTNIIDHARVVYEYTSAYLGSDWQMGVAVANAQPGDLIFYGGGSINHVAIYAGNGMIYDSWPGIGVSYRSMYSGGNILKIVRVF